MLTTATGELDFAKQNKKDFRSGKDYMMTNSAGATVVETGTGRNIDNLEEQKKNQARAIKTENRKRKLRYADTTDSKFGRWKNFALSAGASSYKRSKEAANKIRIDAKADEKH